MPSFINRKRNIMTGKRKIIVNMLAITAFTALLLLPIMGLFATETVASQTTESASVSNDYVFFIVENGEVPLAAAPSSGTVNYVLWIALAYFSLMMLFMYFAWYLTTRRNIRELSSKLMPMERAAFMIPQSFFHPVRCYRLAKEAEDAVASTYARYM